MSEKRYPRNFTSGKAARARLAVSETLAPMIHENYLSSYFPLFLSLSRICAR